MEENKYLRSYFRKGLGQYIKNDQNAIGSRASIDIKVEVEGKKVPTAPNNLSPTFSTERTLSLVGPADIKRVKPDIISLFYPPAINTMRFNNIFMPYMEFFEADFPWRYTPIRTINIKDDIKQCTPWLVLVAVTDDEYNLVTKNGKKKVEFNLTDDRYNEVFPSKDLHNKLAHVQLENNDDEEGISRLLCGSKLPPDEHITVFLLPAFETGRLSGLDKDYNNVNIGILSWADKAKEFPVYYHWSFYTSKLSGTFESFANKLDMRPINEYDNIKANLTVDIAQSGLSVDGLMLDKNGEYVIDVPAALNLALGRNTTLREEPENGYRDRLKEELLLNPVFVENVKGHPPVDEDPWVVPPVYGARHLLSENLNNKDVVAEVNLTLRHRIAAGMGASVVKENQESFVHRAWQKVEKINQLNQELREYYQMQEVEQKAGKRLTHETASISDLKRHKKLLSSDALPRTLNASKLAHNFISVNDIRQVVNSKNWKPVQKDQRIIGITPEELESLFKPDTWEGFINSDSFDETIAERVIEQYKKEHNWMQYLLMPYYNKATDPKTSERKIYGIKPYVYQNQHNNYIISDECTNLFYWVNGILTDDSFTLNYYCNAADQGLKKRSIFHTDLYDTSPKCPISKAVYPVTVQVTVLTEVINDVNVEFYEGYIMDEKLFKQNFGDKPFIAFEYNETLGASVKKEKRYTFLFRSDYDELTYWINMMIRNKDTHLLSYSDLDYSFKTNKWVPNQKQIPNSNIRSDKPFTDNGIYKTIKSKLINKEKIKEAKYDPDHPNMVYLEQDGRKFYIQADGSMGVRLEGKKPVVVDANLYYNEMDYFERRLQALDSQYLILSTPYKATVTIENSLLPNNIVTVETYHMNKEKKDIQGLYNCLYEKLKNKSVSVTDIAKEPEEPYVPDEPNLEEEKRDIIDALIKKYGYTEEAQLVEIKTQIDNGKLSKYPVMIYPDFLDPTFFYLRELSENYILPSAGELINNSVTVFQSNAAFEEAFLMGMNTEMGQELLWREYPTDQRGSYFRKFWVAAQLPEKKNLETEYYDIKKIHNWNQSLGKNHVNQKKDEMLVFAIKGELMQAYPKTSIYLSTYDENEKKICIAVQASMASWLTEDTYLVGFEDLTIQKAIDNNYFLTFQEDVTSTQFQFETNETNENLAKYAKAYKDSAFLGLNLMNTPTVFLLPINNN